MACASASAKRSGGVTSGTIPRSHCSAASVTIRRQRSSRFSSMRSPPGTMLRSHQVGTNRAIPTSVPFWRTVSKRSRGTNAW